MRIPTFVSLFAGAGGMDWGFIQEGWLPASPAHVVECDATAVATYNANVSDAVMMGDVVPTDIRGWVPPPTPYPVAAVIGGFPCPSFSRARSAVARSNPLSSGMEMVEETARVIAAVRPPVFMLECVQQSRRHALPLLSLRLHDYGITTYDIDFCEYGVPQHRRRMLYVGARGGVGMLPPPPTPLPPSEWRTAGDALHVVAGGRSRRGAAYYAVHPTRLQLPHGASSGAHTRTHPIHHPPIPHGDVLPTPPRRQARLYGVCEWWWWVVYVPLRRGWSCPHKRGTRRATIFSSIPAVAMVWG